jgi:hypothetical protein
VTSGTINRTLGAGICAGALVLATLPWLAPDAALRAAGAQTLDLGGAGSGPTLSDPNGAVDLASSLEKEAEELARNAAAMTGEAKARALAVARVRTIAAYLLRGGATKPWSESAPVAAGARLALLVGRVDALADRAIAGRNAIGDPLPTVDAQRALALLGAVAQCQSEPLRRAMIASQERQPAEIAAALGMMLAPLVELARLLEARSGVRPPDAGCGRPEAGDRGARCIADPRRTATGARRLERARNAGCTRAPHARRGAGRDRVVGGDRSGGPSGCDSAARDRRHARSARETSRDTDR